MTTKPDSPKHISTSQYSSLSSLGSLSPLDSLSPPCTPIRSPTNNDEEFVEAEMEGGYEGGDSGGEFEDHNGEKGSAYNNNNSEPSPTLINDSLDRRINTPHKPTATPSTTKNNRKEAPLPINTTFPPHYSHSTTSLAPSGSTSLSESIDSTPRFGDSLLLKEAAEGDVYKVPSLPQRFNSTSFSSVSTNSSSFSPNYNNANYTSINDDEQNNGVNYVTPAAYAAFLYLSSYASYEVTLQERERLHESFRDECFLVLVNLGNDALGKYGGCGTDDGVIDDVNRDLPSESPSQSPSTSQSSSQPSSQTKSPKNPLLMRSSSCKLKSHLVNQNKVQTYLQTLALQTLGRSQLLTRSNALTAIKMHRCEENFDRRVFMEGVERDLYLFGVEGVVESSGYFKEEGREMSSSVKNVRRADEVSGLRRLQKNTSSSNTRTRTKHSDGINANKGTNTKPAINRTMPKRIRVNPNSNSTRPRLLSEDNNGLIGLRGRGVADPSLSGSAGDDCLALARFDNNSSGGANVNRSNTLTSSLPLPVSVRSPTLVANGSRSLHGSNPASNSASASASASASNSLSTTPKSTYSKTPDIVLNSYDALNELVLDDTDKGCSLVEFFSGDF